MPRDWKVGDLGAGRPHPSVDTTPPVPAGPTIARRRALLAASLVLLFGCPAAVYLVGWGLAWQVIKGNEDGSALGPMLASASALILLAPAIAAMRALRATARRLGAEDWIAWTVAMVLISLVAAFIGAGHAFAADFARNFTF